MNLYQYILVALAVFVMMSIFDKKPVAITELHASVLFGDSQNTGDVIGH